MRTIRYAATAAMIAAAALALTACGSASGDAGGSESKGAVAMSFAGADVTIWNDQLELMRPIIEDAGYEFLTDDPQWDVTKQISDWQAWIARGDVKAMMAFPVQADSVVPTTAQATQAGIPTFGYLLSWDGVTASTIVDSKEGGRQLGAEAGAQLVKDGRPADMTVVVFGDRTSDFISLGMDGIIDGIHSEMPSAKIVELAATSREDGYEAAKAQLTADPNSFVWLGASNDPVLGAYRALLDAGVAEDDPDYYLASRDATDETLDAISVPDSIYRSSIVVPAADLAAANAELLIAGAEGEKPESIVVPGVSVTAANASQFYVK